MSKRQRKKHRKKEMQAHKLKAQSSYYVYNNQPTQIVYTEWSPIWSDMTFKNK